jgi:23S rRNA (cytosine1962-C5)-methyltransferase
MKLRYLETNDLIFIDKPYGISTHSPDLGKVGIAEIYEKELGFPLCVVHRLDKTTTGAMVFAKTAQKAEELITLFRERKIQKKYWFLTDRHPDFEEAIHSSLIEKEGKLMRSLPSTAPNSETHFKRIKRSPFYELWEASPKTGRSHQIRLHAADLGMPLLGDTLYGGSAFPLLCLHSLQIEIPGEATWTCPPPRTLERLGLLRDLELVKLLGAIDTRQRAYDFLPQSQKALRLSHTESEELRLDLLGPVLWGLWYKDQDPTTKDLQRMECLASLLKRPFVLRKMNNRGKDPTSKITWYSDPPPTTPWLAEENGLQFEFHAERGLSSGLFLDQRHNRKWILGNSKGKKVLNLFSYTCGFSVAAAAGGATEVTSVDVSADFLNWGKQNFSVNGLDPAKYEFFKQDSLFFLDACIKRKRKFDLLICDPPTFGRHKEGIFRFEKDWKSLLDKISRCLTPQGMLLFCHNFEGWSQEEFQTRMSKMPGWKLLPDVPRGLDYEAPNAPVILKQGLMRLR